MKGGLITRSLLITIVVLLTVPFFQGMFDIVKVRPLMGAITEPVKVTFAVKDWFTGLYQEQQEKYLNEAFGFRSFFIRVNNQLEFSLFNRARANGVIIGKDNYLFETNYIKAYYGLDYIGEDSIRTRMEKLKFIQDTLARLNKNIILVFAAGKGSFYPEYFPDSYRTEKKITNYETYVKYARQLGITHIDFQKYFLENKGKSKYPLYPQYGIHWSYYGTCLAADSLIGFMEQARNIDMPDLYWKTINMDQPKETDYDIADGMNILFRLPSFDMAYPVVEMERDSGKTKPSVLVVADSYYWGMFNFGISGAFTYSHFWFYNQQIFPDSYSSPLETSQVNLREEINKHDVIVIMATEATLPGLGWGFIENTYQLLTGKSDKPPMDPEFAEKVRSMRNYILNDKNWLEGIQKKAQEKGISLDSMVTLDAIWQVEQQKQ